MAALWAVIVCPQGGHPIGLQAPTLRACLPSDGAAPHQIVAKMIGRSLSINLFLTSYRYASAATAAIPHQFGRPVPPVDRFGARHRQPELTRLMTCRRQTPPHHPGDDRAWRSPPIATSHLGVGSVPGSSRSGGGLGFDVEHPHPRADASGLPVSDSTVCITPISRYSIHANNAFARRA